MVERTSTAEQITARNGIEGESSINKKISL
jgi:hypothetical protein